MWDDVYKFNSQENREELFFQSLTPLFHICSSEDSPVFLVDDNGFKKGVSILALCVKSFPNLKLFAYQLMSNHFHLVVSCDIATAKAFAELYIKTLEKGLTSIQDNISITGIRYKMIPIESLNQMRNVIAYVNRNGFVAHKSYTPFNYPWGTSAYYFSFDSSKRYNEQKMPMGQTAKRILTHSHKFDNIPDLFIVDGYVSPYCFCYIKDGEQIYSNARQYFYTIARNMESNAEIAKSIGENIFYTDEDLFRIAKKAASEKYDCSSVSHLQPDAKIELAKYLHFQYNAGIKQIQRLLKLDRTILVSLFPQAAIQQ